MVTNVVSIIHAHEAMLGQIEFLKDYATFSKVSPVAKEIDKNEMTQLIHMICYLKEGLEDLYAQEDNYMARRSGAIGYW